jgi:hypothetical protein
MKPNEILRVEIIAFLGITQQRFTNWIKRKKAVQKNSFVKLIDLNSLTNIPKSALKHAENFAKENPEFQQDFENYLKPLLDEK